MGTNTRDIDYGYQNESDTGDIAVEARVPASFTGYIEAFIDQAQEKVNRL